MFVLVPFLCSHQPHSLLLFFTKGSCGTACCKLEFFIDGETTTEVMNKMNSTIGMKGPDGLYIPMDTAEGTLTFGDLRPFDKPVDFIGQAW